MMVDYAKLEKIVGYFKELDPALINQEEGVYQGEHCGCCVGAHIAHCLNVGSGVSQGREEVFKIVYGSYSSPYSSFHQEYKDWQLLEADLRRCGTGVHNPFGVTNWARPPHGVFDDFIKLLKKEEAHDRL